jgi:hypothetical protein
MTVWVLVFYMAGYSGGGPAVIDNIATMQECERIRTAVMEIRASQNNTARCIQVRKIR